MSSSTTRAGGVKPRCGLARHSRLCRQSAAVVVLDPKSQGTPQMGQRIRVCGRTTTRAERHANSRDSSVKLTRVAPSIRLGFTPRSTSRDSCRRRNRTSASSARPIGSPRADFGQLARFLVAAHSEHRRSLLAGQGQRHLAREEPCVKAASPSRPSVPVLQRPRENGL